MIHFFVYLYTYFQRHRLIFYLSLLVSISVMLYFTLQLRFEENITRFLPDSRHEKNLNEMFDNLRIKDKIIVMFSFKDGVANGAEDDLIEIGTLFRDSLLAGPGKQYIDNVLLHIDEDLKTQMQDFVYNNLPIFFTDSDYYRMDSLLVKENMATLMYKNYTNLLSPAGIVLKDYIMRDPLGLGGNSLKRLQDFQLDTNFEQHNGYIFSEKDSVLLLMVTPLYGMGNTGKNDKLITAIEEAIKTAGKTNIDIDIEYYGGPSVGVYNARQIKEDTMVTVTIALVIIITFIFLVFRQKRVIIQIVAPVVYGGLFSLFMISILKGSISSIAVGAGSVVMGIALSYSIHMVVHQMHVASVKELIKELTYPLTVGSFTTIGAFLGLLFTSSDLLRDFGLFASMTLIGTTLFCLIYLPHFLDGKVHHKRTKLLIFIEKFNSYRFDKNKWLIGAIVVLTVVCVFSSQNVGFDADMMHLNYEPSHIQKAEKKLASILEGDKKTVLFVSVGENINESAENYRKTNQKLSRLKDQGLVKEYASAEYFIIPENEQKERIVRWNNYWTSAKKEAIKKSIQKEAMSYQFKENAFDPFFDWLNSDFSLLKSNAYAKLMDEWQSNSSDFSMLITQVQLSDQDKEQVYTHFENSNETIVLDRSYFINRWISAINNDFYLVLYITSFLIFFTLLISYGRIELTLISFLPMFISWIIIIGVMGLLGIEFNIISIILSTFIFGIGDDFSIFIMDGLINKYRTNKSVLNGHKTAIFFSAFTTVIGMGALVVAKHPALQSISIMSILGMLVVVLVSYTLPPLIFRLLISSQTDKGLPPYTLASLVSTFLIYTIFLLGCILLRVFTLILLIVPTSKDRKRKWVCYTIMYTCRFICWITFFVKKEKINTSLESFKKTSIIIANHQSFIDILILLSLTPKLLMVTNNWVWNSPIFGSVIRYVGYFYIGEGYENSVEHINQKIKEGYSIVIFPEGTRSQDGRLRRFHKGAFYLAHSLKLDIVPIVLYGTGMAISKSQPFYIKRSRLVMKILPRIEYQDKSWGETYQQKGKSISTYFREEYDKVVSNNNLSDNSYFYHILVKNYLYKGPVEEWYVRIKVKLEQNYKIFDALIPKDARVTDIGCGMGMLGYMLQMLSPRRQILGVDYDEDKIEVAQHCFSANENINFVCADASTYDLPTSDVFVLNDVLHYMSYQKQKTLLQECTNRLSEGGLIIVRDGDAKDVKKQKLTRLSEIFSTRILNFNKTKEDLSFTSTDQISKVAESLGLSIKSFKNDSYTSNTIYLLRRI